MKLFDTPGIVAELLHLGVLEARVHVQPVMADGVGPVCRAAAAKKESERQRKRKEREKEGQKAVERTMYYVLVSRGPPNPYDPAKRKSPTRSFYSLENPTKRNLSAAVLVLLSSWQYPIFNTLTKSQNVQFYNNFSQEFYGCKRNLNLKIFRRMNKR